MKIRIVTVIGAMLVFAISFGFYCLTTSPYVSPGDSTEMVTAAVVLGIPHQPGYPLNTYLGHLAYKLNIPGTSGILRIAPDHVYGRAHRIQDCSLRENGQTHRSR